MLNFRYQCPVFALWDSSSTRLVHENLQVSHTNLENSLWGWKWVWCRKLSVITNIDLRIRKQSATSSVNWSYLSGWEVMVEFERLRHYSWCWAYFPSCYIFDWRWETECNEGMHCLLFIVDDKACAAWLLSMYTMTNKATMYSKQKLTRLKIHSFWLSKTNKINDRIICFHLTRDHENLHEGMHCIFYVMTNRQLRKWAVKTVQCK